MWTASPPVHRARRGGLTHTARVAELRYLLTLVVRGAAREFTLPPNGRVVLGRDETCDIPVSDASVSRRHAALEVAGPTLTITDLGSANGTRIDKGHHAAETASTREGQTSANVAVPLTERDCFYLGNVMCTLRLEEVNASRMTALHALADRAATSDIPVLLLGETGVGKEVLAETIHRKSPRNSAPLVRLNCAALSEPLLESELFGHVRGAFTGAVHARAGLIESAHGGTLFLDEVGDMPAVTQVKLLRVLDEKRVLRVGADEPRDVDFRLVSATNRDLTEDVASGRFRRDLFFRISGIVLTIPPLRERPAELYGLVESILSELAARKQKPVPAVTPAALDAIHGHPWPGNVRELKHVLERALVLADGGPIDAQHLLLGGHEAIEAKRTSSGFRASTEAFERARIESTLAECGGNQSEAARVLGIPRRTLVAKLAKWRAARSK
ncbi:MAG: sigma 54-interacting transcriptional regulator [Deltaproteobacteria bacterium]|nr:sigma 54-interacting transcriptional regulator [Deltaproteobacteria bacterium]